MEILNNEGIKEFLKELEVKMKILLIFQSYDISFFICTLVFSQLMYLVFWYEMMLLSEHMIGGARSVRSLTVMVYRNHFL